MLTRFTKITNEEYIKVCSKNKIDKDGFYNFNGYRVRMKLGRSNVVHCLIVAEDGIKESVSQFREYILNH